MITRETITPGKVEWEDKDIDSGKQHSSIIHHLKDLPPIAWSRKLGKLAIGGQGQIDILTFQG